MSQRAIGTVSQRTIRTALVVPVTRMRVASAVPSVILVAIVLAAAGCASGGAPAATGGNGPPNRVVVFVDAPFASLPSVAEPIARGAELAAGILNAAGGVSINGAKVGIDVRRVDSGLSPATSSRNMAAAAADGAVAVIDEGTGVDASWEAANRAGLPIAVTYQGGASLVDRAARPNVYRIAPTDRAVAIRLAEYLIPKGVRLGILHDDSSYGSNGAAALDKALAANRDQVTATVVIPQATADPSAQVLRARQSGATALVVWTQPGLLAQVVRAARSTGWDVPVYAATSGEDPLVRQQLADHPEWADGLTFAIGRLTSEKGSAPFEAYRAAYERRFGPDRIGVRVGGTEVVQPPDQAMYSHDFVLVLAAALTLCGCARPGRDLVAALEQVEVTGANGDERSFNERSHEGVVDDDIAFATIVGMRYQFVKDDPLSATLPIIPQ